MLLCLKFSFKDRLLHLNVRRRYRLTPPHVREPSSLKYKQLLFFGTLTQIGFGPQSSMRTNFYFGISQILVVFSPRFYLFSFFRMDTDPKIHLFYRNHSLTFDQVQLLDLSIREENRTFRVVMFKYILTKIISWVFILVYDVD